MEQSWLLNFPDDILELILKFLKKPGVLACTCKRLRKIWIERKYVLYNWNDEIMNVFPNITRIELSYSARRVITTKEPPFFQRLKDLHLNYGLKNEVELIKKHATQLESLILPSDLHKYVPDYKTWGHNLTRLTHLQNVDRTFPIDELKNFTRLVLLNIEERPEANKSFDLQNLKQLRHLSAPIKNVDLLPSQIKILEWHVNRYEFGNHYSLLTQFTQLSTLIIQGSLFFNRKSESIPFANKEIPLLKTIVYLKCNSLSHNIQNYFPMFPNLTRLEFSMRLVDENIENLKLLTNLKRLKISGRSADLGSSIQTIESIQGKFYSAINQLKQLVSLNIDTNISSYPSYLNLPNLKLLMTNDVVQGEFPTLEVFHYSGFLKLDLQPFFSVKYLTITKCTCLSYQSLSNFTNLKGLTVPIMTKELVLATLFLPKLKQILYIDAPDQNTKKIVKHYLNALQPSKKKSKKLKT